VHNNPLLFVDPLGNDASDYIDGVNSAGIGFTDYLGYTAGLSGLQGGERQNEVAEYLRVYEGIMGQISSNPSAALDAATNAVNTSYQDNPDFIRGRSLVGPSIKMIIQPVGSGSSMISLGFALMAANGDALRAIENGASSVDELVQAMLLGDPLGGMCTSAF